MFQPAKLRALYDEALGRPRAQRRAFLRDACGEDGELYHELEQLLEASTALDPAPAGIGTETPSNNEQAQAAQVASRLAPETARSRFVAGELIGRRYRIVSLLGRGGMGEVYRAEDTKLDRTVALKFLPAQLTMDGAANARFLREARTALDVSHRNVCRIYGIEEANGIQFLVMEFVDGEDLASLLRRIGRLTEERGIEMARQICAAVAATHEARVLHCDLKPANVMIDGSGSVRLTDFGIATALRPGTTSSMVTGTPEYMAPELFTGARATVQSDLYALGLVLYEMFTGRAGVRVTGVLDAMKFHGDGRTPPVPTTIQPNLDLRIERVIMSCLEVDPRKRPASAIQVARRLPGGSPLELAIAAGETPSPEMVADWDRIERLSPAVASIVTALTLVGLIATAWTRDRVSVTGRLPLTRAPELLLDDARNSIRRFGYPDDARDYTRGFSYDRGLLQQFQSGGDVSASWKQMLAGRPPALLFWYREAPTALWAPPPALASRAPQEFPSISRGARRISIDIAGRVVGFEAMPAEFEDVADAVNPDWTALFEAAKLDSHRFSETAPSWTPRVPFDTRAAWIGSFAEQPDLPVRIEAAAYRGRLVAMSLFGDWRSSAEVPADGVLPFAGGIVFVAFMIGAARLALRNLKRGRADRRGAFRLGAMVAASAVMFWLLWFPHRLRSLEIELFWRAVTEGLFYGTNAGIFYLAFEPSLRKRWPEALTGWARLLEGSVRDRLVARQVCAGCALAVGVVFLNSALSLGSFAESAVSLDMALSVSRIAAFCVRALGESTVFAFGACCLFLVLRLIFRNEWLAGLVGALLFGWTIQNGLGGFMFSSMPMAVAFAGVIVLAMIRFGMVAVVACAAVTGLLLEAPLTLNVSAWFFSVSLFVVFAVMALTVWAAFTAAAAVPEKAAS